MLDITAVPTRTVFCPFPLISLDTSGGDSPALFVGRDKAAVVSFRGRSSRPALCRLFPQPHRALTAGVLFGEIAALGDAASAVTFHRAEPNAAPVVQTVFIGDPAEALPLSFSSPFSLSSPLSFSLSLAVADCALVAARRGVLWRISPARAAAARTQTAENISRLFPLRPPLLPGAVAANCAHFANDEHTAKSANAAPGGLAIIDAESGETRMRFVTPRGAAAFADVRGGREGTFVFAALTECGAAALYDTRRAGPPLCEVAKSSELSELSEMNGKAQAGNNKSAGAPPLLASYDGGACDAWAALVAGKFHFMRRGGGDRLVCRSFAMPDEYIAEKCLPRGLCFVRGTLYVIESE